MAQSDTPFHRLPAVLRGRRFRIVDAAQETGAAPLPEATFEAQLLGQPEQRRGLKGGAPVLAAAKGAYLSAEYAGDGDRRPAPGLLKVRKI